MTLNFINLFYKVHVHIQLQVGTIINKTNLGESAFSLCFTTDSSEYAEESELTSKNDGLWVGCRDGSIFKLKGSIDVELSTSRISCLEFGTESQIRDNTENERVFEVRNNHNYDTRTNVFVTCHKRMEWKDRKILIVGYSDGTLKVFDAHSRDKDTGALICTFNIQLCKNAIKSIDDVKIAEPKKIDKNHEKDTSLDIKEDGSFKWISGLFDDTDSSDTDDEQPLDLLNVETYVEMAILVSTETTQEEDMKENSGSYLEKDTTAYLRPTTQCFSLFLHGMAMEKGKYTVDKGENKNDAAMQMMKIASGHDMYLSMGSIIVWSRLKKVVRYIDIPMLIGATKEEIKSPISKALFFMTNQHQRQCVSSKSYPKVLEEEKNNEKPGEVFELQYLQDIMVASILENGRMKVYPTTSINNDDKSDEWPTIFLNEGVSIDICNNSKEVVEIDFEDCDEACNCREDVNVVAVSLSPMKKDCFLTLSNPNCCLSLNFWEHRNRTTIELGTKHCLQKYFSMRKFIQESYWPYETDLEQQMPILVCMTVVYLFKKCYAVIVFSPNKDTPNTMRKKSSLFVTEIPTPIERGNANDPSSWADILKQPSKLSKFKGKEKTRKLYVNENSEISDTITDVRSCPPYFEEYFACFHTSKGVSVWTVKGSQLKWISCPTYLSELPFTSAPYFTSSYTSSYHRKNDSNCLCYLCNEGGASFKRMSNTHALLSLATFTMSYVKKFEGGNFGVDIINVFSGNTNHRPYLHGHSGRVGNISSIPIINLDSTSSSTHNVRNAIKRKWNNESQFTLDKKRRIGFGSTQNEKSITALQQQNRFYSNVMNIHSKNMCNAMNEPDKNYRISSILFTSSFEDDMVKLWACWGPSKANNDSCSDNQRIRNISEDKPCSNILPTSLVACPHHQDNQSESNIINSHVVSISSIECQNKWMVSNNTYKNQANLSLPNLEIENVRKNKNYSIGSKNSANTRYSKKESTFDTNSNLTTKYNIYPFKPSRGILGCETSGCEGKEINEITEISDLVFILNESGKIVVSKFLHENSAQQPINNNELFNCDHNHWEFAKQQRNKQQEEDNRRSSSNEIVASVQYCLECCCSYTAMNNEKEKMSLLMLLGKRNKNVDEMKQNYNISRSSGLTCLEKSDLGKENKQESTKDKETHVVQLNESLNLDRLLIENTKKKKMLQTLGEEGLGKMTSLSAIHISSFNGLTFCPVKTSENDNDASKVESKEEDNPCENAAKCHKNRFETQQNNLTSLDKDEYPLLPSGPSRSNEKVTKRKNNKRRPGNKKVEKYSAQTTVDTTMENNSSMDTKISRSEIHPTIIPTFNTNSFVDQSAKSTCDRKMSSSTKGSLQGYDISNDEEDTNKKGGNKSGNDQVGKNKHEKSFISFEENDSGHHGINYSSVIFITTSFPRMYPCTPSFIIWSYDIMMDDQDTEKGRKSCYDNSLAFEKQCSNTQNSEEECVSRSAVTPVGVIPYGLNVRNKSIAKWDELSQNGHEQHRQPLALSSDIKIMKKGRKHPKNTKNHSSFLEEIKVMVLIGLENGDILEYFFIMSLMPGLTHSSWVMTSEPQLCRKLNYSNNDRIISVQYNVSKVTLEELGLPKPSDSSTMSFFQQKENEGVNATSLSEVLLHENNFGSRCSNSKYDSELLKIHLKVNQLLSSDTFSVSQSIKSYNLKQNNQDSRLIVYGSKEGIIYFYEVSRTQEYPKYELKKLGQFCCGTSSSEIVSLTFIENPNHVLDCESPNVLKSKNPHGMKVLGHVIAANKNADLFLLQVIKSV